MHFVKSEALQHGRVRSSPQEQDADPLGDVTRVLWNTLTQVLDFPEPSAAQQWGLCHHLGPHRASPGWGWQQQ